MVPSDRANVRLGARFPDNKEDRYKRGNDYIFYGMENHPWWHGYHRYNRTSVVNYVVTYIYETKLADQMKKGGNAVEHNCIANVAPYIEASLRQIDWKKELKTTNVTGGKKRAFVWGMAIHNLADSFAHSAYEEIDKKWYYIKHNANNKTDYADDKNVAKARYWSACDAVTLAITDYEAEKYTSYAVYIPSLDAKKQFRSDDEKFCLADIFRFVKEVAGENAANPFYEISISPVYNTK